ncbi:peroxiredoxin [Pseudoxanthomonas kalamensis DSM 18571]|uniref:peroxiredoxin n=1 Tax=Pseudoxanthomonas kalamensis TaxID=289483 RepID=UPI0013915F52|nr:peroxiredoxin [Pseudoxanthomonas kalamensis]KAF1711367.1 peroxiredoxin [Pseudoxanthomonas kalamensis DSM 18571]
MSCTDSDPKITAAAAASAVAPATTVAVAPAAEPAVIGIPRINEPAPAFQAQTTHGPRSLADYKGKWLVLFSHPADFTPVCTTEFTAFAKASGEFAALNTELLGLSIDSVFSHLAWVQNIKEKFGVEIPFPIIEDLSMNVARAYGMIHPGASDTSAVRATFVIDDKGILRAMVYYPMTNGRSVAEILRLVKGLQYSLANGVATPEGWQPGEKVLLGAPKSVAELESRAGQSLETVDWYFSMKPGA